MWKLHFVFLLKTDGRQQIHYNSKYIYIYLTDVFIPVSFRLYAGFVFSILFCFSARRFDSLCDLYLFVRFLAAASYEIWLWLLIL